MLPGHRQWELRYGPFSAGFSRAHDAAARARCARGTRGGVLSAANQARRESAQPLPRNSCIQGSMSKKSRLGRHVRGGQQKAGAKDPKKAAARDTAEAADVSRYAPHGTRPEWVEAAPAAEPDPPESAEATARRERANAVRTPRHRIALSRRAPGLRAQGDAGRLVRFRSRNHLRRDRRSARRGPRRRPCERPRGDRRASGHGRLAISAGGKSRKTKKRAMSVPVSIQTETGLSYILIPRSHSAFARRRTRTCDTVYMYVDGKSHLINKLFQLTN